MYTSDTVVLVTGHAKPVKDDAIFAVYSVFSVSLMVETKDDSIVDLACTTVMKLSEPFLSSLVVGKNLVTDMGLIQEQIKTRFLSLAQKPFIVALRDAQNRYLLAFPGKRIPGAAVK